MRLYLLLALAAFLIVLVGRAFILGRPARISIALVGILVIGLGYLEWDFRSSESLLSNATRAISPTSRGVTCQSFGGTWTYAGAELGHVNFDQNGTVDSTAFISYDTCNYLMAYMRSDRNNPTREQIIAVHVVSHEANHLRGEFNEATTDCRAMQNDSATAQRLGATPIQARRLALAYWISVYPDMPDAYRTDKCHEGGPLDSTPTDHIWPS